MSLFHLSIFITILFALKRGTCTNSSRILTQILIVFTKMKNSTNKPDAVSYDTILGCLSRAGLFEEAAKLMQEMGSKGFQYDLIAYSSVIEAVGKVDDCKKVVMRAIWFYLLE